MKSAVPTPPRVKPVKAEDSPTDPVLAELLAEEPESLVLPGNGATLNGAALAPATKRFELPALPAG